MSNYPNMSYCMVENTLLALRQVIDAMDEDPEMFMMDMSRSERQAYNELFFAARDFIRKTEEMEEEVEFDNFDQV